MTFGQIIKKLRRDADMTQERLAEVLSVSAQAVSRWETDTGMPDVSLLPPLANLFGVTTDHLLGVDITKKGENIAAIREKANAYSDRGYFAEAREILEQGMKQYPNNYRMMRDLMYVSNYQYRAASDAKDTELAEKYKSEAIDLGEAILAGSTEDSTPFRYSVFCTKTVKTPKEPQSLRNPCLSWRFRATFSFPSSPTATDAIRKRRARYSIWCSFWRLRSAA